MRFHDKVGFVDGEVETRPGVWEPNIVERFYYGDVLKDYRRWENGYSSNDTLAVANTISINADAYAYEHFDAIRYVYFGRAKWRVATVEISKPRIKLTIGGVYADAKA